MVLPRCHSFPKSIDPCYPMISVRQSRVGVSDQLTGKSDPRPTSIGNACATFISISVRCTLRMQELMCSILSDLKLNLLQHLMCDLLCEY